MTEASDMDLVREYAAHNSEAAFAELVRRHIHLVYSVALRYAGNPHDAEDVTQAVFIILARKAAGLGNKSVLTGWLYETARFTGMQFVRTKVRRQIREQEAHVQSTVNDPEPVATWRQIAPLLEEAMTRLGEKDRALLALRFFENRGVPETAALLGIGEWAARKRTDRAVKKLRTFFARRGVPIAAATLIGAITANSVQAAPTALANSVATVALAKGATVGGSTLSLIQGALKIMAWAKAKTAAVTAGILLVSGTAAVVVINDLAQPHEPRYQGKLLLDWLMEIDSGGQQGKSLSAAEAIRQMGTRTLPFLVGDLTSDPNARRHVPRYTNPDRRTSEQQSIQAITAFQALGPLGKPAIPELVQLLEQNPGYVPAALAGIGRDALPELLKALGHSNQFVHNNTAAAIANAIHSEQIRPADAIGAVPICVENLHNLNVNVQWRAAELLGVIALEPDVSVPALAKGLEDTNAAVAVQCAENLAKFGDKAGPAVPALITTIHSTNAQLSFAAAQSLCTIDPAAAASVALPTLIRNLDDANYTVRVRAAQALGKLGSHGQAAVPKLIALLQDKNEVARMVSAQSLGLIGQHATEAVPALADCLRDPSKFVRVESVNALAKFGPAARSAVPGLLEAAKASPDLKNNIKTALSKIDPPLAERIK